ncbi:aspartyl-phosphate phosphatase Spo0E family protein [Paenibacillus cremeus]|uniref:Aspartyl-phosphate phosphatase Spo0E family protein n=1 Tax=Paenibacillus cremeus TaxID=2163881 RepID=A0A559K8Q5_9BACL|nr:aspartyl-phosphate phosphatase Spo0E family protein [Paenibacillus cremeus]TVY08510.1 aspartyl-phosphate phosphatase Spo0E family protein [Paenibacillus cremeus]
MFTTVGTDKHSALSVEIEKVREQMVRLGCQFGLMHPEVQRCSQQLDVLLIRYYAIDHRLKGAAALEEPAKKEYT